MKISANEIKVGNILEIGNKLWKVLKIDHTKPGKGGAFIQVEIKDINNGTKRNERFRSEENIEKAHLEQRKYQFLYNTGDNYVFMDKVNFEQANLNKEKILNSFTPYLQDGIDVTLEVKDEEPINLILPETVILIVKETEAVIKGQTAASGLKPAILENNIKIMVPLHIEKDAKVVVKTADNTYVEKVK